MKATFIPVTLSVSSQMEIRNNKKWKFSYCCLESSPLRLHSDYSITKKQQPICSFISTKAEAYGYNTTHTHSRTHKLQTTETSPVDINQSVCLCHWHHAVNCWQILTDYRNPICLDDWCEASALPGTEKWHKHIVYKYTCTYSMSICKHTFWHKRLISVGDVF